MTDQRGFSRPLNHLISDSEKLENIHVDPSVWFDNLCEMAALAMDGDHAAIWLILPHERRLVGSWNFADVSSLPTPSREVQAYARGLIDIDPNMISNHPLNNGSLEGVRTAFTMTLHYKSDQVGILSVAWNDHGHVPTDSQYDAIDQIKDFAEKMLRQRANLKAVLNELSSVTNV